MWKPKEKNIIRKSWQIRRKSCESHKTIIGNLKKFKRQPSGNYREISQTAIGRIRRPLSPKCLSGQGFDPRRQPFADVWEQDSELKEKSILIKSSKHQRGYIYMYVTVRFISHLVWVGLILQSFGLGEGDFVVVQFVGGVLFDVSMTSLGFLKGVTLHLF